MLTKNDCMNILLKLEDRGLQIDTYMRALAISKEPPIEVLKFIASNNGIEVIQFYEMLRKKHNTKQSPLYKNILDCGGYRDDALTTLTCLLLQIVLYSNKLEENSERFLVEARADEISNAIAAYFNTQNIEVCQNLLRLIKSDILVLEYLEGRREIA